MKNKILGFIIIFILSINGFTSFNVNASQLVTAPFPPIPDEIKSYKAMVIGGHGDVENVHTKNTFYLMYTNDPDAKPYVRWGDGAIVFAVDDKIDYFAKGYKAINGGPWEPINPNSYAAIFGTTNNTFFPATVYYNNLPIYKQTREDGFRGKEVFFESTSLSKESLVGITSKEMGKPMKMTMVSLLVLLLPFVVGYVGYRTVWTMVCRICKKA